MDLDPFDGFCDKELPDFDSISIGPQSIFSSFPSYDSAHKSEESDADPIHHKRNVTAPITKQIISIISPTDFVEEGKAPITGAMKPDSQATFAVRAHTPRNFLPTETIEDSRFQSVCMDQSVTINPHSLGFIPASFWPDQRFAFGDIVFDFFQRKNNANSRFSHKLYNALQIVKGIPSMSVFIGVSWFNATVMMVNSRQFSRLLGIRSIDGSLFHQQGNFPTHGFIELSTHEARELCGEKIAANTDLDVVRLLYHQNGVFVRDCSGEDILKCKWVSSRRRNSVSSAKEPDKLQE